MKTFDLVVIGGGSAGLAAAISAKKAGVDNIVVLEQSAILGGILNQCIHNGFGLHYFKKELSGPAYAQRWIDELESLTIPYRCQAMVEKVTEEKIIYYSDVTGYHKIEARSIVLAMGCRERTRGAIEVTGYRGKGVYTAGTAQYYLNMMGKLVGKRVFILGSGDIGLIMARRMTLEGAKVLGVAEIKPFSAGLQRNIVQCLEDFDIPLFLSHSVIDIQGHDQIEQVIIAEIDEQGRRVEGSEKTFAVDTLLLSVGLIPENSLMQSSGLVCHSKTQGAIVDEQLTTNIDGVFACGNVLHVHDVVDFVSEEGTLAGISAAQFLTSKKTREVVYDVQVGKGLTYILPQKVHQKKIIDFRFRSDQRYQNATIRFRFDGKIIAEYKRAVLLPAEMQKIRLDVTDFKQTEGTLVCEVEVEGCNKN